MKRNYLVMALVIGLLVAACGETEKIRIARVIIYPFQLHKAAGFDYFDVSIFQNEFTRDFDDLKVDEIINVGFQIWSVNSGDSAGGFRLYATAGGAVQSITSLDQLRAETPLIFTSPAIAPNSLLFIDWPESMTFNSNQQDIHDYLEDKDATFYYETDSPQIMFDSLAVVVTARTFRR